MSAFFFALNRNGEPFSRVVAERMMEQLDRYGHDGKELFVKDNFALGHQRHWTVPEELGEQQPLYDADTGQWLLFHGRIDNRNDLFASLRAESHEEPLADEHEQISDAALFMMWFGEYGVARLSQIIGPFVFVLYSSVEHKVIAARDAMGGRYLVYRVTDELLLFATYEMALVAHPSVPYELNAGKATRLLTNATDLQPETLIKELKPLSAGQMLTCGKKEATIETFYLPDPNTRVRLSSPQQYADEFKRLLTQAVARRLRSIKPVGAMLSGGLDSVPMAIVASDILAQKSQRLNTFSWVFDEHPEADERQYFMPVCTDFELRGHWIKCDSVWPKFDAQMHCNPIVPFSTPYSAFTQALFAQARDEGVGVMLSGMGGDMLYSGVETLLYELFKAGRWRDGLAEFMRLFSAMPSFRSFIKKFVIGPLLKSHSTAQNLPDWLDDQMAREAQQTGSYLADFQARSWRPQQYFNVLGSLEGEDAAYGRYLDAGFGIERRYPFRDRELAEFMLAIPADQLYFQLTTRPIVRRAFENELRPELAQRPTKTNFSSVIRSGVKNDKNYRRWLEREKTQWVKYVKKSHIYSKESGIEDNLELKWRCAYYEYWKTVCYTSCAQKLG
jgi:asparagine synthase (glutamine-hydrolysing)